MSIERRRRLPLRARLRRDLAAAILAMRRSLSLRVSIVTALALALALAGMGIYVASTIRSGMFAERVEQMLGDAAWRISQAQRDLDQATAATEEQVQGTAYDVVWRLQEPGSGIVGAMMLRSPAADSTTEILEPISNAALRALPSEELRAAVDAQSGLLWQSVAIPTADGEVPGVVIGAEVNVPLAGSHELYLIYTLAPEQASIDLTMRTLAAGALVLVLMVAIIILVIMWRVLRPVRAAALSAERLAAGVLDVKMPVKGDDELATLARSFNEMADALRGQITQLEDLSRLQQRFVSDVSHELRTPLTTIRMAADLIDSRVDGSDPAMRRSVELLVNQLDRFESMLADLLEISRIDAGSASVSVEAMDLRILVRRVVELAEPLADQIGTRIRVHGDERAITAELDDLRVERIVRNLVLNAIEHSNGTPVDVWMAENDSAVAVRVTDRGVGMSPETAARVFDRFWRADPARARTTGGTGLGLAIAMEDARAHGGTLEAWGELGVVASFLLTLPKREGEAFTPPIDVVPPPLAALVAKEEA